MVRTTPWGSTPYGPIAPLVSRPIAPPPWVAQDINTAIMQPRKVAYLEQTVRAMEQGTLKIRVQALARFARYLSRCLPPPHWRGGPPPRPPAAQHALPRFYLGAKS